MGPHYCSAMAKNAAKSPRQTGKFGKRALGLSASLLAALLVGGPSVVHLVYGVGFSPVLTSSMQPYVAPGDLLISIPTRAADLVVGDVISVANQDTGAVYAHRIIESGAQGSMLSFKTKGDANPTAELDEIVVDPNRDIAKSVFKVSGLGAPLVYVSSDQGRQASVTLIVVANLALIFYVLQRRPKTLSV